MPSKRKQEPCHLELSISNAKGAKAPKIKADSPLALFSAFWQAMDGKRGKDRNRCECTSRLRLRNKRKTKAMYTTINFKSKKALKDAVAQGQYVGVYQPNDIFGNPAASPTYTGRASVEGPHYPEPHKWYASVEIVNGQVVKVS